MIKNLLYLSIFTTVVVVSWIAFAIYHNFASSTIPETTAATITPITPTFDLTTLQDLETRSKVAVDLSTNSPFASSGPVSSRSAEPTPTTTTPVVIEVVTPTPGVNAQETIPQEAIPSSESAQTNQNF